MPNNNNQQKKAICHLLFTGHMIDKPGRKEPRFPASKEILARDAIKEKVLAEILNLDEGTLLAGIGSGACGGDIIFHEVCAELGVPTQIYLALPPEQFIAESVAFAGAAWTERFYKLIDKLPHAVLAESTDLSAGLEGKEDSNVWTRTNLWMLNSALVNGGKNMTLIALWDGKGGDGAGGTEDMVEKAKEKGATTIIIDTATLT